MLTCDVHKCGESYILDIDLSVMTKHIQETHANSTKNSLPKDG